MNKKFLLLGVAISGLSCIGVLAILAVAFGRPNATNNDQVMLQIVSVIMPTLIALIGAFKSIETEKIVTDKVIGLKTTIDGNTDHLEKQAIKVADLNEKVETAKVTAEIAAKTAVVLADKVEKLNGK